MSHMRRLLSLSTAVVVASSSFAYAEPSAELIAAAKAEGKLTTIALPHSWCGWDGVIANFKAKYPEIEVNELNPDAGSGDEIEAIKASPSARRPRPKACFFPIRSPPGIRSPTAPRMPMATGTAATMVFWRSS